jgi:hypothetical protein
MTPNRGTAAKTFKREDLSREKTFQERRLSNQRNPP